MEKEFIPYKQALELKELGFELSILETLGWYDNGTFLKFKMTTSIPAPLYQQAFRWFREKHGLGHMINGIGYESFIMNIGGILHIFNAFEFKTYEEAELACLKKLIEIKINEQTRTTG